LAKSRAIPYRRVFWLLACAWTVVAAASLTWNLLQHANEVRALTAEAARALLEEDLLCRQWSLARGGVYVPDSTPAPAGTFPQQEEREVRTPSGQTLVLLNPAEVSRQMFEIQGQKTGIRGHLTSLKPLRPANLPDAWERQALESFQTGQVEASVIATQQGESCLRMMRPLLTNPSCLRCHEEQGHQLGEVRGGISVTVPMRRFATPGENARLAVAHVVLWLIGLGGLTLGAASLRSHLRSRLRAEAEREQLIVELQAALANVKTLSGLIPICSSCKKVRDDQGYWTQIETYLTEHADAEFSHSLCLDCMRKLYPQLAPEVEARLTKAAS
jgi:hypothetical protein